MTRGCLVTLSGVDCSGKTTQLNRLCSSLREKGLPTEALWYRPGYSRLLDSIRSRVRRTLSGALPSAGPSEERAAAFNRPGVSEAWLALAHVDMLAQYAVKVRRSLLAGRVVVCDRYLDDALMDLQFRFPYYAKWSARGISLLREICPRPSHAFLLMLSWDEMLRRQREKNEPFPDPEDVRRRRFARYQQLATSGRYEVIMAERPIDEIHDDLLAKIARGLP